MPYAYPNLTTRPSATSPFRRTKPVLSPLWFLLHQSSLPSSLSPPLSSLPSRLSSHQSRPFGDIRCRPPPPLQLCPRLSISSPLPSPAFGTPEPITVISSPFPHRWHVPCRPPTQALCYHYVVTPTLHSIFRRSVALSPSPVSLAITTAYCALIQQASGTNMSLAGRLHPWQCSVRIANGIYVCFGVVANSSLAVMEAAQTRLCQTSSVLSLARSIEPSWPIIFRQTTTAMPR